MRGLVPVLLALVLTSALAAQLSPSVEKPVSAPVLVPSRTATQVDVASNGELLLAVWAETRATLTDIIAARITAEGEVLDPAGIVLTTTRNRVEQQPRVVWDGRGFVVTWVSVGATPPVVLDAMAIRVGVDGQVSPPGGRRFATGVPLGLTVNNGRVAAVLQLPNDLAPGHSRCVAGLLGDDLDFSLTAEAIECELPRITTLGDGYLMIWTDRSPFGFVVKGQRLDARVRTGGLAPFTFPELGPFAGGITLAAGPSGHDAIVVAGAERAGIARVTPSGSIHRAESIPTEPATPQAPAAVLSHADGSYNVLMHHFSGPVDLYHYSAHDQLLAVSRGVAANASNAAAALLRGRTFVVTADETITGRYADDPAASILISRRAAPQRDVALATGGSSVLVAWVEDRGAELPSLVAAFTTLDGTPVSEPFVVGEGLGRGGRPAVGYDGTYFWAAWTVEGDLDSEILQTLRARRIDGSGVHGEPIVISETASLDASPTIAGNGKGAIIVWSEGVYFAPKLHAAVLGSPLPVKTVIPGAASRASVLWDAEVFGIYRMYANREGGGIRGAALSSAATLSSIFDYSTSGGNPSIAWNGSTMVLVTQGPGGVGGVVAGRTFTENHFLAANTDPERHQEPQVVWDGRSFIVTWKVTSPAERRSDVLGQRIGPDGKLASGIIRVASTDLEVVRHAIIGTGNGTSLVAYARVDGTSVPRIYTRRLTSGITKQRAF